MFCMRYTTLLLAFCLVLQAPVVYAGPTASVVNLNYGRDSVEAIVIVTGLKEAKACGVTVSYEPQLYELGSVTRGYDNLFGKGLFTGGIGEVASEVMVAASIDERTGANTDFRSLSGKTGGGQIARITFHKKGIAASDFLIFRLAIVDVWGEKMDFVHLRVGNKRSEGFPKVFFLDQNDPDPVNPDISIQFGVPKEVRVRVGIFNILGQEIRKLVDEIKSPNFYTIIWDGKDGTGKEVGSGIYFCRLTVDRNATVRNMILLR